MLNNRFAFIAAMLVLGGLATPLAAQPSPDDECVSKGGAYGTFDDTGQGGSRTPYCRLPEEAARKEQCLKDNGKWGPQGMAGVPGCVRKMPDAGKACQTNEECGSKKCLVDESSFLHGKCAEDDQIFGCVSYFEKSKGLSTYFHISESQDCTD